MAALSRTKAEPDNPIRGSINDLFEVFGLPTIEEGIGTPADWAHRLGVPTPKEMLPSPADALDSSLQGLREGKLIPDMPRPESFLPPLPNGSPRGPPAFPPPPNMFGQGRYYQNADRRTSERVIRK